jgi:hypothetical protein
LITNDYDASDCKVIVDYGLEGLEESGSVVFQGSVPVFDWL